MRRFNKIKRKYIKLRDFLDNYSPIEEAFYMFSFCYYNKIWPIRKHIQLIVECWDKYSQRSDIDLDERYLPKLARDEEIEAFPDMNAAFGLGVYSKVKVQVNFFDPLIDHFFYSDNKSAVFLECQKAENCQKLIHIVEFMEAEERNKKNEKIKKKATKSEIALSILSYCYKNNMSIPADCCKIIADGWCRYSQRSDLTAIEYRKTKLSPFKNLNKAFDIPKYSDARIKKEFYSKLVYITLASLRAQGVVMDNLAHAYVGHKYNIAQWTCKNYYTYFLKKGAPSVSGRLKITNKRSGLDIITPLIPEDLNDYIKFASSFQMKTN